MERRGGCARGSRTGPLAPESVLPTSASVPEMRFGASERMLMSGADYCTGIARRKCSGPRGGDHLVRGQRLVQQLASLLGAGDRQSARIEDAHLYQCARLVPVDVLVRHLVPLEAHDHDVRQLYATT